VVKKKRAKRKYSVEYRQDAVDLVRKTGRPTKVIARELGIPPNSLYGWLDATGDATTERTTFVKQDELAQLRKEVDHLRMERDFLKKAAAFFAKESK
jgi:transposase